MFGGSDYTNPADAGMTYLNQIPDTITPYYNPYIQLGQGAARVSAPVYYNRVTNPQGAYNDIMSGYTESPAYQYNYDQAMKQQQGSAAAAGYTGTPYDQQQQAQTATGLLAQDQQQYYNNVLDMQNSGLDAGMHYFDTGYGASDTLAQLLGANLAAQAGLAYKGQANENAYNAQKSNNMFSTIGTIGGATVGGIYGGPEGAMAGAKVGGTAGGMV